MLASLEGGLVAFLDMSKALRMKSGTIHEVETISGGFIVTRAYTDESTLIHMSRWLANSSRHLDQLDDDAKDIALHNWISSARLAIAIHVFESWQLAKSTILKVLVVNQAGKKSLCAFFREIQKSNDGEWAGDVLNELKAK